MPASDSFIGEGLTLSPFIQARKRIQELEDFFNDTSIELLEPGDSCVIFDADGNVKRVTLSADNDDGTANDGAVHATMVVSLFELSAGNWDLYDELHTRLVNTIEELRTEGD